MRRISKPQSSITIMINTFSSNQLESSQSEEILFICKSKRISIESITDINQDRNFENNKSNST